MKSLLINLKLNVTRATLAVLLNMVWLSSSAQAQTTFSADKDTATERQIKNLEFYLVELIEKGDLRTYSGFLTDDYIRVSANGMISTKEQVLKNFGPAKMQGKMKPRDLFVRVYGNTAILRAVLDLESGAGDAIVKRTSVITKVFIKRNDKWYMASMQGSPVIEEKKSQ